MANTESVWLNVKDWQVKPITKINKAGEEHNKYIITLGVDKETNALKGSLDGWATIEADTVIQKDGGKFSVPLDPKKTYSERYVKKIIPEAQVDKKGDPVINPKTGKQFDAKVYDYRTITGSAIVEIENARLEAYKAAHPIPDQPSADAKATETKAADKPADKKALEDAGLDNLSFDDFKG